MRLVGVLKSRGGKPLDFEEVKRMVGKVCERSGVDLFYIFGSYAKNTAGRLSDVDVAYLAEKKVDELKLIAELEAVFEDEAIDLVDLKRAPPHLIHRVLKDGRCLHASNPRVRSDFETRAEAVYWDTGRLRAGYLEKMAERVRNGTFGR